MKGEEKVKRGGRKGKGDGERRRRGEGKVKDN
jgi:hypothetical protein